MATARSTSEDKTSDSSSEELSSDPSNSCNKAYANLQYGRLHKGKIDVVGGLCAMTDTMMHLLQEMSKQFVLTSNGETGVAYERRGRRLKYRLDSYMRHFSKLQREIEFVHSKHQISVPMNSLLGDLADTRDRANVLSYAAYRDMESRPSLQDSKSGSKTLDSHEGKGSDKMVSKVLRHLKPTCSVVHQCKPARMVVYQCKPARRVVYQCKSAHRVAFQCKPGRIAVFKRKPGRVAVCRPKKDPMHLFNMRRLLMTDQGFTMPVQGPAMPALGLEMPSQIKSDKKKKEKFQRNLFFLRSLDIMNEPKRESARLHQKLKKPSFKLPSRDEIWKEIPTLAEDLSSLKHVTPKKTVNNFTKIYNDYNFDDYEDTSDSISSVESSSEEDSEKSLDNQERKSMKKIRRTKDLKRQIGRPKSETQTMPA
ncbi:hypothetical protein Btru_048927 [Bulinus truncatus]|nr:hypothetical protein Btru_048927 [Bulinus truncatus]